MGRLTEQTLPLNRSQTWQLLVSAEARPLWQTGVRSAELQRGFPGGKGAIYRLDSADGQVEEHISKVIEGTTLSVHQTHADGLVIRKKFTLLVVADNATRVSLIARHYHARPSSLLNRRRVEKRLAACESDLLGLMQVARALSARLAQSRPAAGHGRADPADQLSAPQLPPAPTTALPAAEDSELQELRRL